jgi:hypothetical protein
MTDVYDRIKELKIYTKIVDKTNQLDKLFTALSKAQGEFVGMELNAKGWHGDYADLNSIHRMTRPILSKHGLSIVQAPSFSEVMTILGHSSGQHIVTHTYYPCSKTKPLEIGADMTVMRRYALTHLLNIFGDADRDLESPTKSHAPLINGLLNTKTRDELVKWNEKFKDQVESLRNDPNSAIDIEAKIRQQMKTYKK